jgi:hypothetical protein
MSRRSFEQVVAELYHDTPRPPKRAVRAAFVHALAHPRRAGMGARDRRLPRLIEEPPWRRPWALARVGLLAAVMLLGGAILGLVLGPGASPPVGPTSSPSARPVETVTVSGTTSCVTIDPGLPFDDIRVDHRVDECTDAVSDPRVSGVVTRRLTYLEFGPEPELGLPNGSARSWGSTELITDGGTWLGSFTGFSDGDQWRIAWTSIGFGPARGLVYRARIDGPAGALVIDGTIAPLRNGEVVGSAWCRLVHIPEPTARPDGIVEWRGIRIECPVRANDIRLDGSARWVVDSDERPDGTQHLWGSITITNTAGAWVGTIDEITGFDARTIDGVLRGGGDFTGLELAYTLTTEDGEHYLLDGLVSPTR